MLKDLCYKMVVKMKWPIAAYLSKWDSMGSIFAGMVRLQPGPICMIIYVITSEELAVTAYLIDLLHKPSPLHSILVV